MPFGTKLQGDLTNPTDTDPAHASQQAINFDRVFDELLRPALDEAGFFTIRADSQPAAGDIRTDMYFDLVTADLVVADISITNNNVFYELGVRHGVCPHGVFVVQGDYSGARPFDIAPDRSFRYEGSTFFCHPQLGKALEPTPDQKSTPDQKKRRHHQVDHLAKTFERAMELERQTTGSPVYEHLPGLVAVNWDTIQTSRANYFRNLRDEWLELVRIARARRHPGDILTLADDAPTILHRTDILFQASLALIDLGRYPSAERTLRKLIEHDPDHLKAQHELGRVLAQQKKHVEAEHVLRNILQKHVDDPNAGDLLGHICRDLWYLSWRDESDDTRKQKAIDTSVTAARGVRYFIRAHKNDPRCYFAGFNALILIALLEHLQKSNQSELPEILPAKLHEIADELRVVVKYCAENLRDRAVESGDYVEQFWTTATLAGIRLLESEVEDNDEKANQRIREACNVPEASFYQLRAFQERMQLLNQLGFRPQFTGRALAEVNKALSRVEDRTPQSHGSSKRVFLWSGYPSSKGATGRFPANTEEDLKGKISDALDHWKVTADDLAICEGIHEGDILFAEACIKRKVKLRLMLLEPLADRPHSQAVWPFEDGAWQQRFHAVRTAPDVDVWSHAEHLGSVKVEGQASLRKRHCRWIINTARMEAECPLGETCTPAVEAVERLFGLFLWNGEGSGDNPDDPSYLMRLVNEFNSYRGSVIVIDSRELKEGTAVLAPPSTLIRSGALRPE
jgi:tetratricopeptide (TPR) repeat protein